MKLEYSPLSSIQIHDFLERNNINALDIKEIGKYTVILYQTPDEQGNWQLTSDKNSRISGSHGCSNNNSDIAKVSIAGSEGGGGDRGYISFISFIINDNEILEKADRIVVNNETYQNEGFVNKIKEKE